MVFFAVLKSFENIPKHSWNARKSQGDLQKSYEELGIFGGLRLSQFVISLTADHYFWCSGGVPCCFEGVPGYYGMFQGCSRVVLGCSWLFWGCSGDVPGCSGDVPGVFRVPFRGVPGCSGFYRHPYMRDKIAWLFPQNAIKSCGKAKQAKKRRKI